jgi:hypothetical protein
MTYTHCWFGLHSSHVYTQALREVEREKKRQALADSKSLDLEYLKNIILKLFETGVHF